MASKPYDVPDWGSNMAQPLLYHIRLIQDFLGMPLTGGNVDYSVCDHTEYPNNADPLHPDHKLREDIVKAVKWVIADLAKKGLWHISQEWLGVTAGVNEYVLPRTLIAPLSIRYRYSGSSPARWSAPLDIIYPDEYWTEHWETYQGVYPQYATLRQSQGHPLHYGGTITTANTENPPILIDVSANFAITQSGMEIDTGDRVFNTTKQSVGYVDYLTASTWKVQSGASGVSGNDITDSAMGGKGVVIGDILQFADTSWRLITAVNGNTVTLSSIIHRNAVPITDAITAFKIGTANRIVISGGNFFVTDTVEGMLGGATTGFAVNDTYAIEARVGEVDMLEIRPAFSFTDTAPTQSLMVQFWGYPPEPLRSHHEVGLPDVYEDLVRTKAIEYAIARDTGVIIPYPITLLEIAKQRHIHNVRSGDRYTRIMPANIRRPGYAFEFSP